MSRDHSLTVATRWRDKTSILACTKTRFRRKNTSVDPFTDISTVRSWHEQLNHRHLKNSPSSLSTSRCSRAVSSPTKSCDKSPTQASLRLVIFANGVQSACGRYSCCFPVCRGRFFSVLLYLLLQHYQRLVHNYSTSKFIQKLQLRLALQLLMRSLQAAAPLRFQESRDSWAQRGAWFEALSVGMGPLRTGLP